MMASRRVRFTFEPELVTEPVIYRVGHLYDVVTNIRMADVDERVGWVILELSGEPAEIDRAIAWAEQQGVRVDPLAGDVVEG
ncbi:MAG: NIL domain-containing protein [Chloroflexi bacterium]|nr:NIL domain-containing protein [Chloroflexota bacterium]